MANFSNTRFFLNLLRKRIADCEVLDFKTIDDADTWLTEWGFGVESCLSALANGKELVKQWRELAHIPNVPIGASQSDDEEVESAVSIIRYCEAFLMAVADNLEKQLDKETWTVRVEVPQAAQPTQSHMKSKRVASDKPSGKRIFIGHGRSEVWRVLKDFLHERLNLEWEEFNRESPAGMATTERLNAMLEAADFAFLVMTAEDSHADGTKHARENVVHEVGLFQGRLGFRKAIVLLEQDCEEFSNITGLTQIRFPKGNIMAKSEDIRQVLAREGIL
jgi:predicted nucleotide-binding protein